MIRLATWFTAAASAVLFACGSADPAADAVSAYAPPDPALLGDLNTAANFAADMHGEHEGHPRGFDYDSVTASLNFILHPRVNMGAELPEGWNALIPWGQVYADTTVAAAGDANPAGVRFQIRNVQHWMLRASTNRWERLSQTDTPTGANYVEDFQEDANVAADIRDESARGGGISATVVDGYNFHFFPADRTEVDPDEVAAVWALFEARLITEDGVAPAAMDSARLIADVGGDYWLNTTAEWDQWTTNGDWGAGRFKYLTPEWQVFNAHSLTPEELDRSPFAGR